MPDKSALESEREAIHLELLRLDLDEKRENAAQRKSRKDERSFARITTEQSLADARDQQEAMQGICTHRKGGMDATNLLFGNSANYAVIKHTLPFGAQMVVCQRCFKEWHRPVLANFSSKAEYKLALVEYQQALNFPTDNTASGSQMFTTGERTAA